MSIAETAKTFADALKRQDFAAAEAMWAEDVVSIEAMDGPMREVRGKAAVHAKSEWWFGAHEVHSFGCEGPFVNGDRFALIFHMDVTNRESGNRIASDEVALYTVKDGKISEERFFY